MVGPCFMLGFFATLLDDLILEDSTIASSRYNLLQAFALSRITNQSVDNRNPMYLFKLGFDRLIPCVITLLPQKPFPKLQMLWHNFDIYWSKG